MCNLYFIFVILIDIVYCTYVEFFYYTLLLHTLLYIITCFIIVHFYTLLFLLYMNFFSFLFYYTNIVLGPKIFAQHSKKKKRKSTSTEFVRNGVVEDEMISFGGARAKLFRAQIRFVVDEIKSGRACTYENYEQKFHFHFVAQQRSGSPASIAIS